MKMVKLQHLNSLRLKVKLKEKLLLEWQKSLMMDSMLMFLQKQLKNLKRKTENLLQVVKGLKFSKLLKFSIKATLQELMLNLLMKRMQSIKDFMEKIKIFQKKMQLQEQYSWMISWTRKKTLSLKQMMFKLLKRLVSKQKLLVMLLMQRQRLKLLIKRKKN